MNSGVVGALALLAVGGALYLGSTFLGDYFSEPDAATQQVAGEETEGQANGDAEGLALVPDAAETAIEETMEAVGEAVDAITDTTEDLAEGAVDAVTEEMSDDMASDEMAALSDAEAGEVLESLGNDLPEEASEPGTRPVLDVVRVEPSGEVLIAGNAPEGERVGLVYNNEVVAEADVTEGGDFVLVPDEALPTGEGTLEVVVIDENGNRETQSDEQVAVVLPEAGNEAGFLVGVLRPGEPVEIIERQAPEVDVAATAQPSSDVAPEDAETAEIETAARAEPTAEADAGDAPFVIVDAIELEGQEIWIAGAAAPGTVIRLYQDNELLGETVAGDEGRYLFEGALSDATGEVTVRADALAAGSADVIARAEVPFDMPGTEMADADMVDTDMTEAVEEVAQAASEAANETADAAGDAVAEIADNAVEAANNAAEAVSDSASELASNAVEAASDAAEAVAPAAEVADTSTATEQRPADDASNATETAAATPSQAVETTPETAATETTEATSTQVEVAAASDTASNTTPDATPASSTPPASNERVSVLDTGSVIIRRGDNLWRLSRRVFGQGIRYTSIYDANRDQIRDPALIFPGQVFELPTPQEEWGAVPGVEALEPDQIPGAEAAQN